MSAADDKTSTGCRAAAADTTVHNLDSLLAMNRLLSVCGNFTDNYGGMCDFFEGYSARISITTVAGIAKAILSSSTAQGAFVQLPIRISKLGIAILSEKYQRIALDKYLRSVLRFIYYLKT